MTQDEKVKKAARKVLLNRADQVVSKLSATLNAVSAGEREVIDHYDRMMGDLQAIDKEAEYIQASEEYAEAMASLRAAREQISSAMFHVAIALTGKRPVDIINMKRADDES